jgi:hypothetical protein
MFWQNKLVRLSFSYQRINEKEKKFIRMTPLIIVITLFSLLLMKWPNKLECLFVTSLSSQSPIIVSMAVTYPSVALFYSRLLALPATIKSGRKGLPVTNTLAYLATLSVTNKKKFNEKDTSHYC